MLGLLLYVQSSVQATLALLCCFGMHHTGMHSTARLCTAVTAAACMKHLMCFAAAQAVWPSSSHIWASTAHLVGISTVCMRPTCLIHTNLSCKALHAVDALDP
jgi:hypothetical protein